MRTDQHLKATLKETDDLKAVLNEHAVGHRKTAEAAWQEGEARFRPMANSITQFAWIARADRFVTWVQDPEAFFGLVGSVRASLLATLRRREQARSHQTPNRCGLQCPRACSGDIYFTLEGGNEL